MRKPKVAAAGNELAAAMGSNRRRLDAMAKVSRRMGEWRPALEVLREVESVPTRFLQLDVATGVGGWPISRVGLIFGPSAEGKTELLIGLGGSFLARDHFFGFVDAEKTTPPSWVAKMIGDYTRHPGFVSLPTSSYERTVAGVRQFCETIAEAREKRDVPHDTTGIVGVDSIRKLVPEDLMKRLARDFAADGGKARGKRQGVDGFGGRAAQLKAALNAAWMDELVPLLHDTRCAMVMIAREDIDPDDLYADRPKIGGGRALYYDSSMAIRVTANPIVEPVGDDKVVVGEQHVATIYKSKVAGRPEKRPAGAFSTSNGRLVPEGFWPERDVLEVAEECGVVDARGSWYSFGGRRIGNGRPGVTKRLRDEPSLMAEIEAAVRTATRRQA